jgi:hydrogenase maturation protein HypF
MRLESVIIPDITKSYDYEIKKEIISFRKCIQQITSDYLNGVKIGEISAKFHNTIIQLTIYVSEIIKQSYSINKVVLSGGTFQNKYLTENLETELKKRGFEVYLPEHIPVNDQGIAMGQLAIAAKRRELNLI